MEQKRYGVDFGLQWMFEKKVKLQFCQNFSISDIMKNFTKDQGVDKGSRCLDQSGAGFLVLQSFQFWGPTK